MAVIEEPLITATTYISLVAVVALLGVGYAAGNALLPARTRSFDRFVFVWLVSGCYECDARRTDDRVLQVFDGLIHCTSMQKISRVGRRCGAPSSPRQVSR